MKSLFYIFIFILIFFSCTTPPPNETITKSIESLDTCSPANNQELIDMFNADVALRNSDSDDPYEPSDKIRRKRVYELLAANKVITNEDKMNAAFILNHTGLIFCNEEMQSISPENYFLAHQLAKSAFENGKKDAAYFTAVTLDRYLVYTEGYQKYGTQKIFVDDELYWAPIDTTTTDEERAKYNVPALNQLLKEYDILKK